MLRCTHCGQPLAADRTECPECSTPVLRAPETTAASDEGWFHLDFESAARADDAPPMMAIARFGNAAEAGYFAHELTYTESIPAASSVEENFDALSGSWSLRFVLLVPEPHAERATAILQQMIEQTDTEEFDEFDGSRQGVAAAANGYARIAPERRAFVAPQAERGVHWVPIVLTLAAGSVAFWGARKLNEQPQAQFAPQAPIGQKHEDLWDQLASPSVPWTQELQNGRGLRELRFDPERGRAFIREDADGDGRFERELAIQR